ncbi:conserved exported hypothetical protein [Crenothrix polyspora]|uniref:Lipoprotein n=1 Tax=Crenothrix polyspora TaxID=360316 RepID=A0A1R4H9X3_9GAMM|nr:hypothetical protein [Crenothrix polyspora]SJM93045.1 conserved exported hypothetical protein [Crenothrix polyspora]
MSRQILLFLCVFSSSCFAAPRMNHHGEYISKCHNPLFFSEIPAKEAQVTELQDFTVTASDNTDIATIKFSINNEPTVVSLDRLRSNRILIKGHLGESITKPGMILLKVAAESNDGCNGLHAWRVYIK